MYSVNKKYYLCRGISQCNILYLTRLKTIHLLLWAAALLLLVGCSSSKLVPDNRYLLESVEIRSDAKTINPSTLAPYIHQKANSKWFSLFTIPLGTYSLSGRDSTKWLNRTLRKIGEKPVLYDSLQAALSVEDLKNAMMDQGFMHSSVSLTTKTKGKRLKAIYQLHPGEPYRIRSLSYDIEDEQIAKVLRGHLDDAPSQQRQSGRLHVGDQFSVARLDDERKRIADILQDSGYYKFHKDFIQYQVDSAANDNNVDVTLKLIKFVVNKDESPRNHPRYAIRDITYRGADSDRIPLRHSVLENATELTQRHWYSRSALENTYRNFGRMQAIRYTNIQLREVPDTSLLDCDIQIDMQKPSSISLQPEGTNTAGDLGAAASVTYANRNLFHGSELFSLQFKAAFEAITGLEGYQDENFEEYSVEAKLQFPRFIAPLLSSAFRRRRNATTELAVSWDLQNRPEFHRRVFSAAWRYRWASANRRTNYRLDVLDLNYVYMPWISPTFKHDYIDSVSNRNAILRYNYEDLFIMKLGLGVVYNYGDNAFRMNIETAGNVIDALAHACNFKRNDEGQHTFINIAYAQYVKFDFDYTRSIRFDSHNKLVLHGDFGIAYPYGNSNILPFEKRYFSGGANSVRGWGVRELGPGSYKGQNGRIDFINQTGDMKLDLNMEYRTFLFWKFEGAAFIDAGNIWTLRNYAEQPGGQFKFDKFYKQIAASYGLGLRLNFNYFILRFDMGMKAVNPAYNNNREHYAIVHPDLSRDFTFHFAVGMPF